MNITFEQWLLTKMSPRKMHPNALKFWQAAYESEVPLEQRAEVKAEQLSPQPNVKEIVKPLPSIGE